FLVDVGDLEAEHARVELDHARQVAAIEADVADLLYAYRVRHGGYDTSVRKFLAIVCVLLAHGASAANRDIYVYQGADRAQKLAAGAKKEGQVVLHRTMTVQDGRAPGAAFGKKY